MLQKNLQEEGTFPSQSKQAGPQRAFIQDKINDRDFCQCKEISPLSPSPSKHLNFTLIKVYLINSFTPGQEDNRGGEICLIQREYAAFPRHRGQDLASL